MNCRSSNIRVRQLIVVHQLCGKAFQTRNNFLTTSLFRPWWGSTKQRCPVAKRTNIARADRPPLRPVQADKAFRKTLRSAGGGSLRVHSRSSWRMCGGLSGGARPNPLASRRAEGTLHVLPGLANTCRFNGVKNRRPVVRPVGSPSQRGRGCSTCSRLAGDESGKRRVGNVGARQPPANTSLWSGAHLWLRTNLGRQCSRRTLSFSPFPPTAEAPNSLRAIRPPALPSLYGGQRSSSDHETGRLWFKGRCKSIRP